MDGPRQVGPQKRQKQLSRLLKRASRIGMAFARNAAIGWMVPFGPFAVHVRVVWRGRNEAGPPNP